MYDLILTHGRHEISMQAAELLMDAMRTGVPAFVRISICRDSVDTIAMINIQQIVAVIRRAAESSPFS